MNLEVDIKRKETVRVSKKDLLKLLKENEQMAQQITELQTRMTELVEENRKLKHLAKVASPKFEPKNDQDELDDVFPSYDEPFPHFDPNIYFDGASGLNK